MVKRKQDGSRLDWGIMDKKINVLIKKDKTLYVETEDFKGEDCVSAVKELFKTFLEIDNLELTSDYYDGEVGISSSVEVKLWVPQLIWIWL